jgi:hypothetical protein
MGSIRLWISHQVASRVQEQAGLRRALQALDRVDRLAAALAAVGVEPCVQLGHVEHGGAQLRHRLGGLAHQLLLLGGQMIGVSACCTPFGVFP